MTMEQIQLSELARYCGGRLFGDDLCISGITTDTRTMHSGDLFVPIRGEAFDGHSFLGAAAGTCSAVISAVDVTLPVPIVRVEDTQEALLRMAGGYRSRFSMPLCAVTGSTGKTTTKEMTAAILSRRFKTHFTTGNFNNHIGVPRTLFGLDESHRAAVVEMGMNHFGELSRLTRAAQPTVAVITNIGSAHMEFLGSKAGILKAKSEIFEGLSRNGTAVLNGDDEYLLTLKDTLPHRILWYAIDAPADFGAKNIADDGDRVSFLLSTPLGETAVHLPVGGRHNVYDALAACAAAYACGAELADMAEGLEGFRNTGSRQRKVKIRDITAIDDCYNAGPDSMRASLDVLAKAPGRKIAVLGDMLELGPVSREQHRAVCEKARALADVVFLYGDNMKEAARGGEHYPDHRSLADALLNTVKSGDTVLFKGSHGMHMEKVLAMLTEEYK